jgi:hypothetical protein
MSDRIHSLTVVLEKDVRDEHAEKLMDAIRFFQGVQDVQPHVSDIASHMAESRARHELGEKIIKVIFPSVP